jgi:hypothetical protein
VRAQAAILSVVVVVTAGGAVRAQTAEAWLAPKAALAQVTGQVMLTLHAVDGTIFGHEAFLPGGQVIWQYPDGTCLMGQVAIRAGAVCYNYDGVPGQSCLRYQVEGGGLVGYQWDMAGNRMQGNGPDVRLRPSRMARLDCGAPPVG